MGTLFQKWRKKKTASGGKAVFICRLMENYIQKKGQFKFSDEKSEDMFIYGDLKHFGISQKDFQSANVFRCKNNKFFREKTGVDQAIGACERMDGERVRKARIIIDYDADFPRIVTRVISL